MVVINSSKGVQSGESIRVESFRLNRRTEQEPSYFEAVFADETVQYRYGFEVDENVYTGSGFIKRATSARQRRWNCSCVTAMSMNCIPNFRSAKRLSPKMVRDNALLLSVAAQFNESVSVEIMGWLANTTIVLGSSDERIWEMAIAQIDDPSMKGVLWSLPGLQTSESTTYARLTIQSSVHTSNMTRRATPRRRSLSRSA